MIFAQDPPELEDLVPRDLVKVAEDKFAWAFSWRRCVIVEIEGFDGAIRAPSRCLTDSTRDSNQEATKTMIKNENAEQCYPLPGQLFITTTNEYLKGPSCLAGASDRTSL